MSSISKILPIDRLSGYMKNAGLYFTSSLTVAIIGLLLNPIMAMNLSPEDYAVLGYYSSFNLLLIPLLHCCILTYYTRQYYFIDESKRDVLGDTILLSMNIIGAVSCLLFMGFFYIFHRTTGNSFPFFPYAVLTFVQLYISNNVNFYLAKLRITRQAKKFAWFSIIQCVVTNALVVLLVVYYKEGAQGKLYATLAATILFAIYAFSQSLVKWRIDKELLVSALKFGFPLTISALFWYCLTGVDRLFLERLGETEMLGIYNVGLAISGYMQIFYTTLSNTFEPDIYQTIAQKNRKKLALIMGAIIGIVALANMAFVLFAPFLIDVLTAGRYVDATPFARILSIHNITMAIYYMVVRLLIGNGYVKGELLVRIIGAVCSVVAFYILIQHYGFYGAAWGQVLSFAMLAAIGLIYFGVKKKLGNNG